MSDLAGFFTRLGMDFEALEGGAVNSAFTTDLPEGGEQSFDLLVLPLEDAFGDKYVRFTIVPYIDQPYNGYPDALYISIGQINHDLPQLKFALDADGDLELACDTGADNLDDLRFQHTIHLLADYASTYYSRLKSLIGTS